MHQRKVEEKCYDVTRKDAALKLRFRNCAKEISTAMDACSVNADVWHECQSEDTQPVAATDKSLESCIRKCSGYDRDWISNDVIVEDLSKDKEWIKMEVERLWKQTERMLEELKTQGGVGVACGSG